MAKQCLKCGTSHRLENLCFVDVKDLVCAGFSKHGHSQHACILVMVQSIAVAGATPSTPSLSTMPPWKLWALYNYLEDISSDDNIFDGLEVHPKVTPLLKVHICHSKEWFVYASFPDSDSTILLVLSELTLRFRVEVLKTLESLPWLTAVNGNPLHVDVMAQLQIGIPHSGISIWTIIIVSLMWRASSLVTQIFTISVWSARTLHHSSVSVATNVSLAQMMELVTFDAQ